MITPEQARIRAAQVRKEKETKSLVVMATAILEAAGDGRNEAEGTFESEILASYVYEKLAGAGWRATQNGRHVTVEF